MDTTRNRSRILAGYLRAAVKQLQAGSVVDGIATVSTVAQILEDVADPRTVPMRIEFAITDEGSRGARRERAARAVSECPVDCRSEQ